MQKAAPIRPLAFLTAVTHSATPATGPGGAPADLFRARIGGAAKSPDHHPGEIAAGPDPAVRPCAVHIVQTGGAQMVHRGCIGILAPISRADANFVRLSATFAQIVEASQITDQGFHPLDGDHVGPIRRGIVRILMRLDEERRDPHRTGCPGEHRRKLPLSP